jgi:hypothetical protein
MKEIDLDKIKQRIGELGINERLESVCMPTRSEGRKRALWNFSLALMDAEVETITLVDTISKSSHDLAHLCGIHKFKFSPCKADEMRLFWGMLFQAPRVLDSEKGLRDYIEFVCENSWYRAGKSRRPMGLFGIGDEHFGGKPWRTDEWYAARRKPTIPYVPITEFYPYISATPTDDHALIIAVDSLVPKGLADHTRADICQDMIVSVLSGDVLLENLRDAVPKFIKQYFKQSPSKYNHLSLDHPVPGDPYGRTVGECIAK